MRSSSVMPDEQRKGHRPHPSGDPQEGRPAIGPQEAVAMNDTITRRPCERLTGRCDGCEQGEACPTCEALHAVLEAERERQEELEAGDAR